MLKGRQSFEACLPVDVRWTRDTQCGLNRQNTHSHRGSDPVSLWSTGGRLSAWPLPISSWVGEESRCCSSSSLWRPPVGPVSPPAGWSCYTPEAVRCPVVCGLLHHEARNWQRVLCERCVSCPLHHPLDLLTPSCSSPRLWQSKREQPPTRRVQGPTSPPH